MTVNKQFAKVGDLTIHYDLTDYTDPWRTDDRDTLLLYPGYCGNIEFWRAWVPLLGRDYRVLRMDARGYGDTSKPPPASPLTTDMLANDAIGLMESTSCPRMRWSPKSASSCGFSMSNRLATKNHEILVSHADYTDCSRAYGGRHIGAAILGNARRQD